MTKDKYNLFGRKKRATVPRKASDPNDPPRLLRMKPEHIDEVVYHHKISKLEPPQDPRPEVPELVVRPQLSGTYLPPILPRIFQEPLLTVREHIVSPKPKPTATSTSSFFSAVKPLAAKPLLKIPEPVLKEVVKAPPVPGSREAKLRAFISKHF